MMLFQSKRIESIQTIITMTKISERSKVNLKISRRKTFCDFVLSPWRENAGIGMTVVKVLPNVTILTLLHKSSVRFITHPWLSTHKTGNWSAPTVWNGRETQSYVSNNAGPPQINTRTVDLKQNAWGEGVIMFGDGSLFHFRYCSRYKASYLHVEASAAKSRWKYKRHSLINKKNDC